MTHRTASASDRVITNLSVVEEGTGVALLLIRVLVLIVEAGEWWSETSTSREGVRLLVVLEGRRMRKLVIVEMLLKSSLVRLLGETPPVRHYRLI